MFATSERCGTLVGVDIDVLDHQPAHRVACIATEMLGMTTACRIGRAPKILLTFRTDEPFDKIQTPEFHMLDGTVARVEILATGQQFVAFGIHPDTKAPYYWPECSPTRGPQRRKARRHTITLDGVVIGTGGRFYCAGRVALTLSAQLNRRHLPRNPHDETLPDQTSRSTSGHTSTPG